MADNTLASWAPFLYDIRGEVREAFPTEAPLLAQLSGVGDADRVGRFTKDMDGGREIFSDKSVKHTIILAELPAGGFVTENQTWNVAVPLSSMEVHINLVRFLQPFTVSVDVERDSFNKPNADAVATAMRQARIALARRENLAFLGDGTGLVATITAGTSPGLTVTLNAATPSLNPMDILLPGTIWDVITRSTGADAGQGLRRKIASVSESAGTVTFDTANQASDGGTGNITFSSASGIYIPGSWSNGTAGTSTAPGALVAQGLEQIAAVTGTFETQDKAAVAQWRGTDGRQGVSTVVPLTDQLLGQAVRVGRRAGLGKWDYAIGDPAVIDLYKDGKIAQVRYQEQTMKVASGFQGIVYDGADAPMPLLKEPAHAKGGVKFVDDNSLQLYGDSKGPDFLTDDGAIFRRFLRTLIKEADMLDRVQLGAIECNTLVFINNLAQA
jgi:hypothetical protein